MNTSLIHDVSEFLFYEADLLDTCKYGEWLDLFDIDAIYWIPSSSEQTDMKGQVSIILEDMPLLKLRVQRLGHPRAYSVTPPPASTRLVGNVRVKKIENSIISNSKLFFTEIRDDVETQYSGSMTHHLKVVEDGFRIKLKRIDLAQAGGIFSIISAPL